MSQDAVYLYGFTLPSPVAEFQHAGHEEIGPAQVRAFDGLAAILSAVPAGVLEAKLAAEPPDAEWIVPRVLHHERVLVAVLERAAVLPVRFGTVFTDVEALARVVAANREPIHSFLRAHADDQEWTIRVLLDEGPAMEALLREDPALSSRFRALPASPGTRYFLEKRLREDARGTMLREGRAVAEGFVRALQEAGLEVRRLPVPDAEATGRVPLLKLAVLLRRGQVDDVLAGAGRALSGSGPLPLVLEPTGPWPAYHFCPSLGEPSR